MSARRIKRLFEDVWYKIHETEDHMSAVDDALAEADEVTNEIAADLDALAEQLANGKTKAEKDAADKIRLHTDKLRGVAAKYPVESDEPVADGEPVPDSSPQTLPVPGGDPLPVSHFPEEPAEDDHVADGEPVPAGEPTTSDNGVDGAQEAK